MHMATEIFKIWRVFVLLISSEWILTKYDIPNGGAVIFFRSLLSSVFIFLLVLVFLNVVDPSRTWEFSLYELRTQIVSKFTWFGAIFAAMYTGLYARYSSQWSYLANLYNSIKQTEAISTNAKVLAQWKAGFLEDADNLHIACKGTFVSTIKVWGELDDVKEELLKNTPGGEKRFNRLLERANYSLSIVNRKKYGGA